MRALGHLEELGESGDLAITLDRLGWIHRRRGLHAEAEPYLTRAVTIAEGVGDPVVLATTMLSLGALRYRTGQMDEGLAMLESALRIARDAGDLSLLLRSLLVLSEGLEESAGEYLRAAELVREGVELARRAGHEERLAWMLANLSDYLVDLGRLEEAEPYAREGLGVARAVGEIPRIGFSLVTLGYLCALTKRVDEAERLLDELRALMEGSAESYHLGWEPVIAGCVALGRGDEADAARIFLDGAVVLGDRAELWGGQQLLLEAIRSAAASRPGADVAALRERLAEFASTSIPARAFLAWADGWLSNDPAGLASAAKGFEAIGRRIELGRVLLDLGSLGDGESAERGRAMLEACGAKLYLG
jgi:tetratricopeptide (TPR) repeat protein